jgi:hypothetical protein
MLFFLKVYSYNSALDLNNMELVMIYLKGQLYFQLYKCQDS